MLKSLFLHLALWCDHLLELSQRDNSNKWSHQRVWWRNRRNIAGKCLIYTSFPEPWVLPKTHSLVAWLKYDVLWDFMPKCLCKKCRPRPAVWSGSTLFDTHQSNTTYFSTAANSENPDQMPTFQHRRWFGSILFENLFCHLGTESQRTSQFNLWWRQYVNWK